MPCHIQVQVQNATPYLHPSAQRYRSELKGAMSLLAKSGGQGPKRQCSLARPAWPCLPCLPCSSAVGQMGCDIGPSSRRPLVLARWFLSATSNLLPPKTPVVDTALRCTSFKFPGSGTHQTRRERGKTRKTTSKINISEAVPFALAIPPAAKRECLAAVSK